MDTSKKETRHQAILTLTLFGAVLVYFGMMIDDSNNARVEDDLIGKKLKFELLLSEKLLQQKENLQLKEELKNTDEKYKEVDSSLKSALEQLATMEKELNKRRNTDVV